MFFLPPCFAVAQDLSVEVASNHVDITVGFTGTAVEVFGDRRDIDADVALLLIGPEKKITVWSKAQVLGAWVNYDYAQFKHQAGYYHYATSFDNPDDPDIAELMRENRIGLEGLYQSATIKFSGADEHKQAFIDALTTLKTNTGVYAQKPVPIKFINDHFFRASFPIPPAAPTGEYKIQSFLIKKGKVIEADVDILRVEQVGVNAFVLQAARNYSTLYALGCIILAVAAGWFSSVFRLRP